MAFSVEASGTIDEKGSLEETEIEVRPKSPYIRIEFQEAIDHLETEVLDQVVIEVEKEINSLFYSINSL